MEEASDDPDDDDSTANTTAAADLNPCDVGVVVLWQGPCRSFLVTLTICCS